MSPTLLPALRARALAALLPLLILAAPALAHEGVHLHDPYARVTPQSGAIYLYIQNHADVDDRLLAIRTESARMAMPMSMIADSDGVMRMADAPQGFLIPAGGTFVLAPGHEHLMLMGLTQKLKDGDMLTVTLTFANSGDITLSVPVMSARKDAPSGIDTPYDVETANDGQVHDAPGQHDMHAMQPMDGMGTTSSTSP